MTDEPTGEARDQGQTGLAIAPLNAKAALMRCVRTADRWVIVALALFIASLGGFLANPLAGIVPVAASVMDFLGQHRRRK